MRSSSWRIARSSVEAISVEAVRNVARAPSMSPRTSARATNKDAVAPRATSTAVDAAQLVRRNVRALVNISPGLRRCNAALERIQAVRSGAAASGGRFHAVAE
jgi:hypothetical protein